MTTLSDKPLQQGIGSSRYSIYRQGLATTYRDSSCLAMLFFDYFLHPLKYCDIVPHDLSTKDEATQNCAVATG